MFYATYTDDFSNRAVIEEKRLLPYCGSPVKEPAFILSVYSDYENGFMHYRAVYPTKEDALEKLNAFSCGTFKELREIPVIHK